MEPIEFPQQTAVFAKDQPEYLPLPAHRSGPPEYAVTTCWRLSLVERLKLLVTGRIWWSQLTFGGPLQPQRPSVDMPEMPR